MSLSRRELNNHSCYIFCVGSLRSLKYHLVMSSSHCYSSGFITSGTERTGDWRLDNPYDLCVCVFQTAHDTFTQSQFNSITSVQFNSSVLPNSLWPHGLQHARLPCPSPTPGAYSKFMFIESVIPSNYLILCHPFSSCLQPFLASGSFPMRV